MIRLDDVNKYFSERKETFSDESIRTMTGHADLEMARRSVPGIAVFIIVFIITTFITDFPTSYPVVFSLITVLLSAGIILRTAAVVTSKTWRIKSPARWRLSFFCGIILTAGAWGGYLAAIVFVNGISLESFIPLLYTAGIGAGSVSSFCMRRTVANLYVIAIYTPVIFAGVLLRTPEAMNASLAILIFAIWSFVHCKRLHQDFWHSLVSNHLLELQAEKLQQAKETSERTNRRLEVAGAEMKAFLDHSPVGVVVMDSDQKISHVNPELIRLSGYSREELMDGALKRLFSSREVRDAFKTKAAQSLEQRGVYETDKQLRSKDGSLTWCHFSGRIIEQKNSKPGIIWTIQDITKRKETEAERLLIARHLEQTQRLESLNVMAGAIAHHFNNIMMGLSGNLELLQMQAPSGSKIGKMAANAGKAAARASKISDSMLTYVGQRPMHKEAGELSGLVQDMEELLRDSVSPLVGLSFHLDPQPAVCEFDDSQIRQVILNLVLNANEAIGDSPGEITLSTGCTLQPKIGLPLPFRDDDLPPGQYVFCEIADSGTGMDKFTRERMFDPFFSTRFTGRGLGLAVVTGIVKAHNGALMVKSRPEEGTTVTLLLPLAEKVGAMQPEPLEYHDAEGGRLPVFSGVVLLADDDLMVAAVGDAMLKRLGFEVFTAVDGQEAIDLYTTHRETVCLVILDVSMPKKDGIAALRELKEINGEVKVILASGYAEDEVIKRNEKKQPNGFLHKPFKLRELADTINKVLSGREGETDNADSGRTRSLGKNSRHQASKQP